MTNLLALVVYMAVITWLTLIAASLIRAKGWTPQGMRIAFGNRDKPLMETPFSGRADRTARNTLENFVLFAALALTAQIAGVSDPRVLLGAQIFFWARLLYIPIYYAGITYVRTAVWLVSIAGLAMMVLAMLR